MPKQMSTQRILTFLTEAPRTGQVATVRADNRPHVATVWFTVDDGDIVFATSSASVKAQNLRRNPAAAFSVDDGSPPFSYAVIEGTVTFIEDMDQVRAWGEQAAARYMGEEWAKAYVASDMFPDDLLCRLTPHHLSGMSSLAA